ncbi:MAG: UDP-N-acetylmuramoylalanyl-D-glutamate--2,6-diaminopimelate ligase [Persephonella sp.]|nr:MAG: UDP-N-acetylmuramoylalanyl-D-glutamate--2,6-diaminopimelate ligase [Persephonella sp.]
MLLKDLLRITKGKAINLKNPNLKVSNFSIDSRQIKEGDFFVAIKGNKFDGHKFIKDSLEKGAKGYITERDGVNFPNGVLVDNTVKALSRVGRYKTKFLKSSVAITGTAGKTTTKEMAKFVLSQFFNVYSTKGNLNNEIGLPLTLANIKEDADIGVFELGASKVGDIKELVSIFNPDIRVLTSVGYGHIKGFGSIEGVIKGKGEIFIDSDKNVLPYSLKKYYSLDNYITFGSEEEADIKIKNVKILKDGTFGHVEYGREKISLKLPVFNKAIFNNISAVSGILYYLDLNPVKPLQILNSFNLPKGRGQVIRLKNIQIIDDSYNANPLSVENAIKTLDSVPSKKVLILGDMLELGKLSEYLHRQIGKLILKTSINKIFLYGKESFYIYDELKNKKDVIYSSDKDKLIQKILDFLIRDKDFKTILIKGSRGMKMEEILDRIKAF